MVAKRKKKGSEDFYLMQFPLVFIPSGNEWPVKVRHWLCFWNEHLP